MPTPAEVERAKIAVAHRRLEELLQDGGEFATQVRGTLSAAANLRKGLRQRRRHFEDSGHYQPSGIAAAMKPDVEKALADLNTLWGRDLEPRLSKFRTALAALPAPALPELDSMERHRLVMSFQNAGNDERMNLLATIKERPKLATALAQEDPMVTNLPRDVIGKIRQTVIQDEHADERDTLQRKITALEAATLELDDAAQEAKSFLQ